MTPFGIFNFRELTTTPAQQSGEDELYDMTGQLASRAVRAAWFQYRWEKCQSQIGRDELDGSSAD
jgi:hypothetical protein